MLSTEPAKNLQKNAVIRLMAETLPLAGDRGVRADLPGWLSPEASALNRSARGPILPAPQPPHGSPCSP